MIKKFEVNWEILTNSSNNNNSLSLVENIPLSFNGSYSELKHMQGGEFSESGELLYLVSGSAGCLGFGPGEPEESDGIHVFQTSDWQEIETSEKNGDHHFLYHFDNSCEGFFGAESPEGLTIWDLDDGSVNQHKGSLHVLVFHWNYAFIGNNDHKISMHHFSNKVYLDTDATIVLEGPLSGNEQFPFENLEDANSFYPIWDGVELIFQAGNYTGSDNFGIIINKKVKLTSEGGPAIIGQQ